MESLETVNRILNERYSFSKGIAQAAFQTFGDKWADDFEETISVVFRDEELLGSALKGYSGFAMDFMRRQKRFEKERTYEHSSYSKASEEVYHNAEHMMGQYLPGLLLAHYFWNHQYRQLTFFEEVFLTDVSRRSLFRFCEVGIGTGLYSRRAMQLVSETTGVGFDISKFSKKFTDIHIKNFGFENRYESRLDDITTIQDPEAFDFLICVEVLEHLEDPVSFLKGLKRLLKPGGKAFVAAALNSPDEDHIYLYNTSDDVLKQLAEVGFALEQSFHAAAFKPLRPDLPYPSVASFIVY